MNSSRLQKSNLTKNGFTGIIKKKPLLESIPENDEASNRADSGDLASNKVLVAI